MRPDEHGRHIAIVGDAELDEGNIFETLLETRHCRLQRAVPRRPQLATAAASRDDSRFQAALHAQEELRRHAACTRTLGAAMRLVPKR